MSEAALAVGACTVLIAGQLLQGVLIGVFVAALYVLRQFLRAPEAIADAQQRLAARAERGK